MTQFHSCVSHALEGEGTSLLLLNELASLRKKPPQNPLITPSSLSPPPLPFPLSSPNSNPHRLLLPTLPQFCNAAAHAVAHHPLASSSRQRPLLSPSASSPATLRSPIDAAAKSGPRLQPPPPRSPSPELLPPPSVLHPRLAVLLGVNRCWHVPLLLCRALSTVPAAWWGLRCALTFLGELVREGDEGVELVGGLVGGLVGEQKKWSVEKRFRVTESALAVLWCSASAYLSFFFTDCLMSRWLVFYTPQATIVRMLTINSVNAYITSWVLYLSGGSEDPRLLLPAWISIASTLTIIYHIAQRKINIRKETSASISVFSIASYISLVALLLQLHLSRANDPPVPLFLIARKVWDVVVRVAVVGIGPVGRGPGREREL